IAILVSTSCPLLGAGPVYNVNTTGDVVDAAIDGVCSTGGMCNGVPCCTLRAALMEASFGPNPTAEEITVNVPAGMYKITIPIGVPDDGTNGDLFVGGKVTIQGAGRGLTILDGNHVDRVLVTGAGSDVKLNDLTLQGGRPPGNAHNGTSYGRGAGIFALGSL